MLKTFFLIIHNRPLGGKGWIHDDVRRLLIFVGCRQMILPDGAMAVVYFQNNRLKTGTYSRFWTVNPR